MEKGLGALGFWLALGIFLAAGAIAGALKEQAKEREKQATLRALLERGGEGTPEILAYLREKDAAEAARAQAARNAMGGNMNSRQTIAFAGAFMVGMFSFMGGVFALIGHDKPQFPRFEYSAQAGRIIPVPPPLPPTGLEAFLPIGVTLGIWAAGLIIAVLIVIWGGFGKQKNDAQPDA